MNVIIASLLPWMEISRFLAVNAWTGLHDHYQDKNNNSSASYRMLHSGFHPFNNTSHIFNNLPQWPDDKTNPPLRITAVPEAPLWRSSGTVHHDLIVQEDNGNKNNKLLTLKPDKEHAKNSVQMNAYSWQKVSAVRQNNPRVHRVQHYPHVWKCSYSPASARIRTKTGRSKLPEETHRVDGGWGWPGIIS